MAACTQTINPPTLESVVGSEALPARFYRRTDRLKQADRLIQELVDLLGKLLCFILVLAR